MFCLLYICFQNLEILYICFKKQNYVLDIPYEFVFPMLLFMQDMQNDCLDSMYHMKPFVPRLLMKLNLLNLNNNNFMVK